MGSEIATLLLTHVAINGIGSLFSVQTVTNEPTVDGEEGHAQSVPNSTFVKILIVLLHIA